MSACLSPTLSYNVFFGHMHVIPYFNQFFGKNDWYFMVLFHEM